MDVVPATRSLADLQAAALQDGMMNRLFLDPLYGRGYPSDVVEHVASQQGVAFDFVQPGDLAAIAAPTDFLGVNMYTRLVVSASVGAVGMPPMVATDDKERD